MIYDPIWPKANKNLSVRSKTISVPTKLRIGRSILLCWQKKHCIFQFTKIGDYLRFFRTITYSKDIKKSLLNILSNHKLLLKPSDTDNTSYIKGWIWVNPLTLFRIKIFQNTGDIWKEKWWLCFIFIFIFIFWEWWLCFISLSQDSYTF